MAIADLTPVLLVCQQLTYSFGDFLVYKPQKYQPIRKLQPSESLLQPLVANYPPVVDHSSRQPYVPLQTLNLSQQPFSPFQQPSSPLQQPELLQQPPSLFQQTSSTFQQPKLPQQLLSPFQQPNPPLQPPYIPSLSQYQPQYTPYSLFQQSYPPQQQPTEPFNWNHQHQKQICPLPTPTCADGRQAICERNALTGHPVYDCPNTVDQREFPWSSRFGPTASSSSMNSSPDPNNATTSGSEEGERSLSETPETVPTPSAGPTTAVHGLRVSEMRNPAMDSSLTTNAESNYPLSGPLCSVKTLLEGCPLHCYLQQVLFPGSIPKQASGSYTGQPCRPGQPGCLPNAMPPLGKNPSPFSHVGYQQPSFSTQFSSGTSGALPLGAPALGPSTNIVPPVFPNSYFHLSPASSGPRYSQNVLAGFNDVIKFPYADSYYSPSFNYFTPPQSIGTFTTPKFFEFINYIIPGNSDHSGLQPSLYHQSQPTRTEIQAHQNQLQYPSAYSGFPQLPFKNVPNFQVTQARASGPPQNPLQNQFPRGNLVYHVQGMPGSMIQGVPGSIIKGARSHLKLGTKQRNLHTKTNSYQPTTSPKNPLTPYVSGKKPQRKTTFPITKARFKTNNDSTVPDPRNQNPQDLRSYINSGLSVLSQDEGRPRGQDDDKPAKKTHKSSQKPSSSRPKIKRDKTDT